MSTPSSGRVITTNITSVQPRTATAVVRYTAPRALINAIPLQPDWGLPAPKSISLGGINLWTQSVKNAFEMGKPEAMADY